MLKNITIVELEKNGKKFPLHLEGPTTYGELFDVSMELRQFAINGINEIAKQDAPKAHVEPKVEEISVPKEFTE